MSQQQPRRPANLPAGTSSLSDRIAALQRKSSTNGSGVGTSRTASAGTAGSSTSSSASGHLSPANSPARSVSAGSQAVKDRIARFQQHDKPLLPKSSFGAPSPMGTERHSNALRPYPGANASGSGSGQWGENILRPQLTGGTWIGAGEGKGWADVGSVRPQLTGSAWLGAGGAPSPTRATAGNTRSPTRQRDAFLDLDEGGLLSVSPSKRVPLRRGSSFSDAQMAAASSGLSRGSRESSTDGSERGRQSPMTEKRDRDSQSMLSALPDTPSKTAGLLGVSGAREAGGNGITSTAEASFAGERSSENTSIALNGPNLPSPPSGAPVTSPVSPPRDVKTSGDIEISVGGASPAQREHLQRTLSASHERIMSDKVAGPIPTPPAAFLQELLSSQNSTASQNIASSDDGASDIGRLAIRSDFDEEDASSVVSPFTAAIDLPLITVAGQSESGDENKEELANMDEEKIPPASPTSTLMQSSTEVEVKDNVEAKNVDIKKDTSEIDLLDSIRSGEERRQNGSASSDGTLTASTSAATVAANSVDEAKSTMDAQRRAKEAIAMARNKSQKVKIPPVGRPMTSAEMDASDEEYEPGWASVISSTSNRT